MTKEEVISELLSLARQSEDSALVNDAGAACHRAEYEALRSAPNEINYNRMSELREYIILWPQQAKRLRKEKEVFLVSVEMLKNSESPL